jgi:integral membrane protein (TIGR01906 family)
VSGRLVAAVVFAAIALAVPALLVVTGLRVVAEDSVVRFELGRTGFPADPGGMTTSERTDLALVGLHSILPQYNQGLQLLREARLPSGQAAFGPRELRHMADVRARLADLYRFQLLALGVLAALAVLLAFTRGGRTLVPRALRVGALLTIGLAALVALLVLTSYDTFFTPFHRLFFAGNSWRFAETDTLRRLYPDVFWRDTAIAVGVLSVVQASLLLAAAGYWARKAGAAGAARPRARTLSP